MSEGVVGEGEGILKEIKMKKIIIATVVASVSLVSMARTFTLSAWRGETVAAVVPDFVEYGELPEGLNVKFGILHPVKYAPAVGSIQRLECLDRVEWEKEPSWLAKCFGAKKINAREGTQRVVEVAVPADAKPGDYQIGSMTVRVVDRVLPPAKDWKYFLDLWQHPWAVSRYFNVKPFSKAHYEAMRPVYETLATAGQKTLTVTLLSEAWDHQCRDAYGTMIGRVKKADGTWVFDYSLFDEYVEFGRSCGLGPDIACYTMCPWGYRVRWNDEDGKEHSVVALPGSPEFKDYWGAFLVDFAKHLKEKGWFNDTYIAMDERSINDVKEIGSFIRSLVPEMKVAMAGNHLPSAYGTTIDNFCMILGNKIDAAYLKEAKERKAKGMTTTYYVCCGPIYPNTFMSSGNGEAFWLGVYPAMCGLDGFLRWAWNSWPQDPVKDATYWIWRAGDTYLVYPDGSPSLRFLELRNGIIAAEKVRILQEQGLYKDEIKKLSLKFDPVEASKGKSDYEKLKRETLKIVNK